MFTHLLVFLVANGVFAGSPQKPGEPASMPVERNKWPGGENVLATVHGVEQHAPHSGQACVYVEWAEGHTVKKQGNDGWVSFGQPTASRAPLVFRSKGGDQLRVHPSIVRFFLPPSFEGTAPAANAPPTHTVASVTLKEFCLREGQSVYVKRTEGVHWLPAESESETPKREVHEGFVVSGVEGKTEPTPSSLLR